MCVLLRARALTASSNQKATKCARSLAEASVERENAVLCVGKKFESRRRCALLTAVTAAAAALCILLLLLLLLLCNNRTRKTHINKIEAIAYNAHGEENERVKERNRKT